MPRLTAIAAAVALLLCVVGPVAAARPDREPAEFPPLFFEAGLVCEFDTSALVPDDNQKITTFFDSSGNPRSIVTTGRATLVAVNEETGDSVSYNSGGRTSLRFEGDTLIQKGSGISGLFFFPGDATPAGVGDGGLFIVMGSFHMELDLNTNVITVFEFRGRYVDVCAALTPG